jgi:hypothetical protein
MVLSSLFLYSSCVQKTKYRLRSRTKSSTLKESVGMLGNVSKGHHVYLGDDFFISHFHGGRDVKWWMLRTQLQEGGFSK